MTQYAKDEYNKRLDIDFWLCAICGKPATQRAHRIANNTYNKKKYKKLIDHNINIALACSLECNHALSINNKPLMCEKLTELLTTRHHDIMTIEEINNFIDFEKKT